MRALRCLREWGRAHGWGATSVKEERLESLVPSPSANHPATDGSLGIQAHEDGCNEMSRGDAVPGCVATSEPSAHTRSKNKPRQPQIQHGLDGAWVGTQRIENENMSSFIIAGNTLTAANNRSYRVAFGQEPNTIAFGDSDLQLAADGTAWLHFATSQNAVCYKRVNLPTPSFLSSIEGSWKCRGQALQARSTTLTIQGKFWHLSAGRKSIRGLVHINGSSGAAMLFNHRIQMSAHGKLSLHPSEGRALKFRRAAPRNQLWTLAE